MSAEHCPYCGTEHDPDSVCIEQPAWTGRTLPNGIKVLENLGSTRDGPLYRAVEPGGREVALLVPGIGRDFFPASRLPLHHDPRFHQALRIRHVNVAAVHEIGELPNGPGYVVLEYLTGEPLSDLLAERGVLPANEAVDLFFQAAGGLEAAHDAGVVHANLSPENILVTRSAGHPLVKLIRFTPDSFSSHDLSAVASEYASPERLAGHIPDERSDVFSLGAVLHHLLTGTPSGLGAEPVAAPAMHDAVAKAMLPTPEDRFQTIAEFVAAMKDAVAHEAVTRRARRRRPLVFSVLSILAVAAGGSWLAASSPWRASVSERFDTVATTVPAAPVALEPVLPEADSAVAQPPVQIPPPIASTPAPPLATPAAQASGIRSDTAEPAATGYQPMESTGPGPGAEEDLPKFLPLEERSQIDHRIGLDEARQLLGGPAHAIEGMSPVLLGLARSRYPDGADTGRPLVRSAYLAPNGELILLDQQQLAPGSQPADVPGTRWVIGDVIVFLHGEAGPAVLANLAKRVR